MFKSLNFVTQATFFFANPWCNPTEPLRWKQLVEKWGLWEKEGHPGTVDQTPKFCLTSASELSEKLRDKKLAIH